jgi:ribosomal-protein-alanine N-acetyltransferase
MTRIGIRRFEIRDLSAILKIETESFGRDAWTAELFREYTRVSGDFFLVARIGRRIAGYSIARVTRSAAELDSLAVRRRDRRRGVAAALMAATLRKLRRLGARWIGLMVRRDNQAAVNFYKKWGFVRTATVNGYYEDGATGWRMKVGLSVGRSTPPEGT